MMVEPQETKYLPKHMKETATEATRAELRKLADELPDGLVLSVDLREVIFDGKEDG